jgi:hypothetical protein
MQLSDAKSIQLTMPLQYVTNFRQAHYVILTNWHDIVDILKAIEVGLNV